MKEGKVLIIEDNLDVLLSVRLLLKKHFSVVNSFEDPKAAFDHLQFSDYDVVLLDMNFSRGETSGREGVHWLKKIMLAKPQTSVIMMTAYGDVEVAIKAIRSGAMDFVLKPWQNEKLLATVSAGLELSRSRNKVKDLEEKQRTLSRESDSDFSVFIGESAAMKKIAALVAKVGKTDANILILGENGTGKEVVARMIHRQSLRSNGVFVKVDLGAIPETLFESELFGHKKGAFTDAREDRAGRMEVASGGTLFLDEIGNLSVSMQSKLLTCLQSRQVVRVGTNVPVDIDIRLVCATNMPLYDMSGEKQFRRDLLYRINTVEIHLPPLRERREDIRLLAAHYLEVYSRKYLKAGMRLSADATRTLREYDWPGNVRELQHAVERAVILGEGEELESSDFAIAAPAPVTAGGNGHTLHLGSMEKQAIHNALQKHQGNISRAAKELGLTRAALYRRMEKHGI